VRIDADEVGGADLGKVHAEGIDPEVVGVFGVADRDVAGDAFGETETAEEAEGGGEADFSVTAFLGGSREGGGRSEIFDPSGSFDHMSKE
jgi:hypothetical protein